MFHFLLNYAQNEIPSHANTHAKPVKYIRSIYLRPENMKDAYMYEWLSVKMNMNFISSLK